jgi:hypothetical protein
LDPELVAQVQEREQVLQERAQESEQSSPAQSRMQKTVQLR